MWLTFNLLLQAWTDNKPDDNASQQRAGQWDEQDAPPRDSVKSQHWETTRKRSFKKRHHINNDMKMCIHKGTWCHIKIMMIIKVQEKHAFCLRKQLQGHIFKDIQQSQPSLAAAVSITWLTDCIALLPIDVNSYATPYRWKSKMSPWPPRCPANNCTWTWAPKKATVFRDKKEKDGGSTTRAVCCSNKGTLLPSLQQSWCRRGICNAAKAGRKQLFKFP